MQIPPDWDKAKKYGKANMCVNNASTKLDLNDPSTFCPYSKLPYADDEDLYSITVDNDKLGEIGEGFPVLF